MCCWLCAICSFRTQYVLSKYIRVNYLDLAAIVWIRAVDEFLGIISDQLILLGIQEILFLIEANGTILILWLKSHNFFFVKKYYEYYICPSCFFGVTYDYRSRLQPHSTACLVHLLRLFHQYKKFSFWKVEFWSFY